MLSERAVELGRLIGQSAEYQAVKRANEALNEDREVVAALQTHAAEVSDLAARGMQAAHEAMMARGH